MALPLDEAMMCSPGQQGNSPSFASHPSDLPAIVSMHYGEQEGVLYRLQLGDLQPCYTVQATAPNYC